jgi:hypothetical protein
VSAPPARVDLGGGYSCGLRGIPAAPAAADGTVTIVLGALPSGRPLVITVTSLEWLDDLESAVQVARARGVVEAGMARS